MIHDYFAKLVTKDSRIFDVYLLVKARHKLQNVNFLFS